MIPSRTDLDAAWRWFRQPWTDLGIIVAMVAALSVPAFLVSTAARFEEAVSDSIASEVAARSTPEALGLSLTFEGRLHAEDVQPALALAADRLERVDELGPVTATVTTRRGRAVALDGDRGAPRSIVAPTRFLARSGAIDGLDVIAADPTVRGVYVSEDLATRAEVVPGGQLDVVVGDVGVVVDVEGIYRNLWPSVPDGWADVPPGLVPRFSPVFNSPTFELLVIREAQMEQLGLPGIVRLDAPVERSPTSVAELERLPRRYRAIERDLVTDPELVDALGVFAGLGEPVPAIESSADEARDEVRAALRRLDQPLLSAQSAGLGLGLLVVAAAASFTARKRATQLRLLVNGGRRTLGVALVSIGQHLVPAVLGTVLGAGAGLAVAEFLVPDAAGGSWSSVGTTGDLVWLGGVGLVSVVLIGVVQGVLAVRLVERPTARAGQVPAGAVLVLAGGAVAAWFQVGRTGTGEVDPLVVAFPILALVAALGFVLLGGRWLIRRAQGPVGRLGPTALFTVRRIGHAQAGLLGLTGALGVATGILVFATVVSDSQSRSLDDRTTTRIGAASSAILRSRLTEATPAPPGSTAVATWSTRLTPGGDRVTVLAIDPATFADVVDWPDSFGRSADEVVALLEPDAPLTRTDPVPAVALRGRGTPGRGAVGTVATYGYEIVAEVESFPLATDAGPVLLVDATVIEQAGRLRFESDLRREFGADVEVAEFEDRYEPPLGNVRVSLISTSPPAAFRSQLDEAGLTVREVIGREDLTDTVDEQATRWALAYLRVVGIVGLVAAAAALVLHASERAELGRLRARMAARTGIPSRVRMVSAVLEAAALTALALAGGVATSMIVAARVLPRFDPLRDLPPASGLVVSPWRLAAVAAVLLALVVGIGAGSEWSVGRREVDRGR